MRRAPSSLFDLASAMLGGAAIGAGFAGIVTGATMPLIFAPLCALACAILQVIVFRRALGNRLDAMLSDSRQPCASADDYVGRRR